MALKASTGSQASQQQQQAQMAAMSHQLHLSSITTLTTLLQHTPPNSTLLPKVEQAILGLLEPFLPQSNIIQETL